MRIYLIGFMGAGKTTVAKTLASHLKIPFVDLDAHIEHNLQMPITQIFDIQGETHFRQLETQTLKQLSQQDNIIISTGGGTPCFNQNMDFMLENGLTVYLKLPPKMLLSRLENAKSKRPLLRDKSPEQLLEYIESTLAEREKYYCRANIIADNSSRDLSALLTAISYY